MDINRLRVAHLQVFAMVAEERNLTRAAARLGLAQPSVSRSLTRLESHLGVRLLERTTRTVLLTRSGEVLHRHCGIVLDALAAAEEFARRAADITGVLVVGCKPDGDAGLLRPALERFATDDRAVAVELRMAGPTELVEQLRRGRLDVGLVQGPFDTTGLDTEPLLCEPRLLALGPSDPLAEVEELDLSDVPIKRMIQWPEAPADLDRYYRGRDVYDDPLPQDPCLAPPQARELSEALRLVELGVATTLLPTSVANRYQGRAVQFAPIRGVSPATLTAAWAAGSRSPQVAAFVRAVTDCATELGPGLPSVSPAVDWDDL